jgi:ABC-type multidrug transport system fused ATPase/permease subunit
LDPEFKVSQVTPQFAKNNADRPKDTVKQVIELDMSLILYLQTSVLWKSIGILSRRDRFKIPFVLLIQIILGLLDLLGVAIIGIVGALAVTSVSSGQTGIRVSQFLEFLGIENLTIQSQVIVLGLSAALILVLKTLASGYLVRRTTFFLARRGAVMSGELTRRLFSANSEFIKKRSPQENLFALTTGIVTISIGILATSITLLADVFLLIILLFGLAVVDFYASLITFCMFAIVGVGLYRAMHLKAKSYGSDNAIQAMENNQTILEVLGSYREILVRNRREFYASKISKQRLEIANINASLANMPNVSKYAIEITLVLGALVMSAIQFLTKDAVHAVGILSVFLAGSSRIAPAVLRIQQSAIQIRSNSGSAGTSLKMIDELREVEPFNQIRKTIDFEHTSFTPEVRMNHVSFTFVGNNSPTLNDLNISVEVGEMIAIVGPSGAGKSTLVDVLLGILECQSGEIRISGSTPAQAIDRWAGGISYLPQDVYMSIGTIKNNVGFGFEEKEIEESLVWRALEIAQLKDFVMSLPDRLETKVTERGENFSGGQRQRFGIARAMYTNPKLLILDEATSALDAETEADFSDALRKLKGKVTVVMIAHRLSSILGSDRIYYLEEGRIIGAGTFEELRARIPNFARQASLMGL